MRTEEARELGRRSAGHLERRGTRVTLRAISTETLARVPFSSDQRTGEAAITANYPS